MKRFRNNPYASQKRDTGDYIKLLATLCLLVALLTGTNFNDIPTASEVVAVSGLSTEKKRRPIATIAYAVTLTGCKHEAWTNSIVQGAAILRHSIFLNSFRNPDSGSLYDFKMYAIVHPSAEKCLKGDDSLSRLGYEVLVREVPFDVKKIKGEFLRREITRGGCCGEKEYLKLYGYTLTDHKIVVLMDLDAFVREPLDDLFDAMLVPGSPARERIPIMYDKKPPKRIDAFITKDYNMLNPGDIKKGRHPGVQGGFLVVKPDLAVFEEYRQIVLKGHFTEGNGWGDAKYGHYYGDKAIQGICSYYYGHLHPEHVVELNRCFYNTMVDTAYFSEDENLCTTGEETCMNCRQVDHSEVKSVHFTECQKPWWCFGLDTERENFRLCDTFTQEWFRVRDDLEDRWAKEEDWKPTKRKTDGDKVFRLGFCKGTSEEDYIPLTVPKNLHYGR